MNVKIVNFQPFLNNEDSPAMPPPEMAAAFARFSRNNQGLDSIIESVKDVEPQERADKILKFADYGHRSILDMITIPICIEGISMYAAARLFQFAQLSSGQESSTRYIREGFNLLPIHKTTLTKPEYEACEKEYEYWAKAISSIPETASRTSRNRILDRVRYSLPIIATTNLCTIQSARGWQETLTKLESYPYEILSNECTELAQRIRHQIKETCGEFAAKHTGYSPAYAAKFQEELRYLFATDTRHAPCVRLLQFPSLIPAIKEPIRKTRYCPWPSSFDECQVEVLHLMNFAEIRDLNRHRNFRVKTWSLLGEPKAPLTLGVKTKMREIMSLSQLLYIIEIRTSEGAHQVYRQEMNTIYQKLLICLGETNARDFIKNNMFDNQGMKDE